ncbi:MAG: hypothetical protein ACTSXP_17680 [Promethearchaeota archaeon]
MKSQESLSWHHTGLCEVLVDTSTHRGLQGMNRDNSIVDIPRDPRWLIWLRQHRESMLILTTKIARIFFIALGTIIVIASLYLVFSDIKIPGLSIEYELDNNTFVFDFTFIIFIIILVIGFGMIVFWTKLSKLPKNIIVSFPIHRLISGILLTLVGLASLVIFGYGYGHDNETKPLGAWLFLGGLSSFYPTGFLPLVVGSVLLIVCLFSFVKIKVSVKVIGGIKDLVITEMRFPRAMSEEIPIKEIQAMQLTNRKTGAKYFYLILFMPSVVFLFIDGLSFLLNPNTFGNGWLIGWAYVISGSVQLISMMMLVWNSNFNLEIITKNRIYMLQYYPINLRSWFNSRLDFFLEPHSRSLAANNAGDCGRDTVKGNGIENKIAGIHPSYEVAVKQRSDFKRVCAGIFLTFLGIISRVEYMYAGEVLRFVLLIAGIIVFVEGVKADIFLFARRLRVIYLTNGGYFLKDVGILYKTHLYISVIPGMRISSPEDLVKKLSLIQPRKLMFLDHLVAVVICVVMGLELSPYFIFTPVIPSDAISYLFREKISLDLLIIVILFFLMIDPQKLLRIPLGDRNYSIPISMSGNKRGLWILLVPFVNFYRKYKEITRKYWFIMLARALELVFSYVLGISLVLGLFVL